jgi:Rha family phage regulatory protein
MVSSLSLAKAFNKKHKDVLRTLQRIQDDSGYSQEFIERNFALNGYTDSIGRSLPMYNLTEEGFAAIAMSFTGRKADEFREKFLAEFVRMREELQSFRTKEACRRIQYDHALAQLPHNVAKEPTTALREVIHTLYILQEPLDRLVDRRELSIAISAVAGMLDRRI